MASSGGSTCSRRWRAHSVFHSLAGWWTLCRLIELIALVVPVLAGATLLAGYASSVPVLVAAVFYAATVRSGHDDAHSADLDRAMVCCRKRGRAVSLVVLGHQGGEATIPLACSRHLRLPTDTVLVGLPPPCALLVVGLPFAYWCLPQAARTLMGSCRRRQRRRLRCASWTRREVLRDPIFWTLLTGVLAPAFIGTTIFLSSELL